MLKFLLIGCLGIWLGSDQLTDPPRREVVKFDAIEKLITRETNKIEVINFWATWCKPCIKELPYFETIHQELAEEVVVTLVSLDYAEDFNSKVLPFVKKRHLTTDILLLDEVDYNKWIDRVEPSWSGAIPATLVINHQTGRRIFAEQGLKKEEIEEMIKSVQ